MKEEEIISQTESDLVDEICQKFEQIGIDTSEWEYRFGDGHTAAEFIEAGIKWYLENKEQGSESYWKKRCVAAELYMSLSRKEYCYEQDKAYQAWQQLKSSIGEETEGQDELWLQLFNDLDKWSRTMKSSEDTLPKIQELKLKYKLTT